MGIFFRKRIMKLPFGGRLTFGTGGFGLTFGKNGTRLHINSRGSYIATKVPGTNIYVGKKTYVPKRKEEEKKTENTPTKANNGGCGCIGCLIGYLLLSIVIGIASIIVSLFKGEGVDSNMVVGLLFFIVVALIAIGKAAENKSGR